MDGSGLPPKLLSTLSQAADIVRRHRFINLYSHFDADGITSISIVAKALLREGIAFNTTVFPVLSSPELEVIRSSNPECMVITDLGASYVEEIEALDGEAVILDHHELKFTEPVKTAYANPHLYGVDGGKNACGATMALLFAVTLDDRNWDLSPLAITGMIGDMQTKDGVHDFNEYVFKEAEKRGFVQVTPGSLIPDGELVSALTHCTMPYIRSVAQSPTAARQLLKEAGIEPGAAYADLDEEKKQILSSLITVRLVKQGVTLEKLRETCKNRYFFPTWGIDGETLSGALDGCGRNECSDVGIAAGMGDRAALKKAIEINNEYKAPLLDAIKAADATLNQMDNIQWTDTSTYGFSGLIATIVAGYIGVPNKVAITVNLKDEIAKASARGTDTLLAEGVNLADAMSVACREAGGEGGGHNVAAGGQFPRENYDRFLEVADRIVGEQLGKS